MKLKWWGKEEEVPKPGNGKPKMILGAYSGTSGSGDQYTSQFFLDNMGVDSATAGFSTSKLYKYADNWQPKTFFGFWEAARCSNPWARYSIKYLNSQLFSNYHFEGGGAPQVTEWWTENNMYSGLYQLGESTLTFGTGIGYKVVDIIDDEYGELSGIETLHTPSFSVDKDEKTWDETWEYTGTGPKLSGTWTYGDKYMDKFVIFRPERNPRTPWGFNPLQSSIHSLQGLHEITINDIPAAARNYMATPRVMKVNVDAFETEEAAKNHMNDMLKYLSDFNSARSPGIVIQDINEIGTLGAIGGGASGSKLEDVMKFIEPLTSCIFLNIFMPIANFRQEGGNRAIMKRQAWIGLDMISSYKRYVADEVFRQIIEPHIDYDGDVWMVHDPTYEQKESQREDAVMMYEKGVIPREYAQMMIEFDEAEFKEKYGFTELTYFEDIQKELVEQAAKLSPTGTGTGRDTRYENEQGEENNDSTSGSESEVGGG